MIRSIWVRVILASSLGFLTTWAAGCSAPAEESAESAERGTLSLPVTVTANGHDYRFSFQAYLYWPDSRWLYSTNEPDETHVSAQLATGSHELTLQSWGLERADSAGNYHPVEARLISSSYVRFEIANGSTTTVSFQFETDGQLVTVGSGSVHVTADVDEVAPPCEPLGDTCGEGLWCPPSELLGRVAGCIATGTVEVGAACASPWECVANSTCVDSVEGPVCSALCSSAEFELECASGGVCQAAGLDYGVCVNGS